MENSSKFCKYPGLSLLFILVLAILIPSIYAADYTFQWDANHPNDNVIEYRIYYSTVSEDYEGRPYVGVSHDPSNYPATIQHSITISDPPSGQFYYFVCTAWDGNFESDYSFEVEDAAPRITSPPTITNLTETTAVISWSTDEPADSDVQYGADSAEWDHYALGQYEASLVIDHSISIPLAGLPEGTPTCYFRVGSTNGTGQGPVISGEGSFSPISGADTDPPIITTPPTVTDTTDKTAVIVWVTDEPADSQIQYGDNVASWDGYDEDQTNPALVTNHSVTITGLMADTDYFLQVGSKDGDGNGPTISSQVTFKTDQAPDTTAPVIVSTPTVTNITYNSAIVAWETDEPATSIVEYGLTTSYARSKTVDAYVTNHSVTLTLLEDETLYHYRVGSTDEAGNGPRTSGDGTFTTEAAPDETAPVITSTPTVIGVTDTTATIVWDTDEPSNSQVRYELFTAAWDTMSGIRNQAEMVQHHTVTLTGLTDANTYYFRVGSTDAAGNGPDKSAVDNNPSAASSFATQADSTPPVIVSAPTVTGVTDTTASIVWDTNEPSNSQVRYADFPGSWFTYNHTKNTAAMVTHHVVTLTGLEPGLPYYFRAGSTDLEGNGPNPAVTADNNPTNAEFGFTTLADQTDPVITSAPTVTAVTNSTAIISWTTDEPANSLVQYGEAQATWGTYEFSENIGAMVMDHNVTLTGLKGETPYFFRVGATDGEGNGPVVSGESGFTTEADPDTAAPVITSPPTVTGISFTTATVTWETDEPCNSLIRYDKVQKTWATYTYAKSDAAMVTLHSVTLTGLSNGQRYYFRVAGTDAEGNGPDTDSEDGNPFSEASFITEAAEDTDAPSIVSGITVSGVDNASAVITWETDEPSNSIVKYGTESGTWGTYFFTKSNPTLTTSHSLVLTGLQPELDYWFRVGSVDAVGNGPDWHPNGTNPSAEGQFTTLDGPDLVAPQIVAGPSDPPYATNRIALIAWTTDEPSNSQVAFGNETSTWGNYPLIESDAGLTTAHSVTIVVQPGTTYFYRVGSTDRHGNGADLSPDDANPSDPEISFTSETGPDETAPQIFDLAATPLSDTTARVTWTTDEPGNSQVRYDVASHTWEDYPSEENDGALTTAHEVTLTNLSPGTLYYVRVSSTDATGNTYLTSVSDRNPSIEVNLTTAPADPPAIVVYPDEDFPKLDPLNHTVDITFDELNMQNATVETNYQFDPPVAFAVPGDSIDPMGSSGSRSRFRLYLDPAEDLNHVILTLTVSADITDADGLEVQPKTVRINDKDGDDLPDDWEEANGLLSTSSDISAGEGRDGDKDGDFFSNYEEFFNKTAPNDVLDFPSPPEILQVLPHQRAGISDTFRVPDNSSFAVLVEDKAGIDLGEPESVVFSIDDGLNAAYDVNLGRTAVVRTIVLDDSAPGVPVQQLWVVYDRSLDETFPPNDRNWPLSGEVSVAVTMVDSVGQILAEDYRFRVESQLAYDDARDEENLPAYSVLSVDEPPYNAGFRLDAGELTGAALYYRVDDVDEIPPQLGPIEELPAFSVTGVTAVGESINLQPPNVFSTPVKLVMPTPDISNAAGVDIYLYDGTSWVLGCTGAGVAQVDGWMVPGSRVNGSGSIELKVRHFSGLQAAVTNPVVVPVTPDDGDEPESPDDMGTCFVGAIFNFEF